MFLSYCEIVSLDQGIFLSKRTVGYLGPKQSPLISHGDLKKDSAQLCLEGNHE